MMSQELLKQNGAEPEVNGQLVSSEHTQALQLLLSYKFVFICFGKWMAVSWYIYLQYYTYLIYVHINISGSPVIRRCDYE